MENRNQDQELLATKLAIPPMYCKKIISRIRLHHRLDRGARLPLTLITAPAGFGKTTLISAWLQQRQEAVAWVSLEASDNDIVRFWRYVITALAKLHPHIRDQIATWPHNPASPDCESMLTTLINALITLPDDILLIFDDYHTITAQAIHSSLAFLLEHQPPQLHLMLSARTDPPLPLSRLRVLGRLAELHAIDLRFTLDETAALLTQNIGLMLTTKDIAELNSRTDGWAAGLQLAELFLQERDDPAIITNFIQTFTGTYRHVLHYLTDEVLARLAEDVQTFLLLTSILDRLNVSLCDAVTRQSNARAMLEHLDAADLFLIPLDNQGQWFRYHHLFTDLLRHRLQMKQPALIPELHSRASQWYEQQGMLEDAIKHAFAAADVERVGTLIEHCTTPVNLGIEAHLSILPLSTEKVESEEILIEKLSEREHKVLGLIAAGLSNQEIAKQLVVTVSTIKTHLNNIYTKLNVHTRLQAVTKAYDLGLLRRVESEAEYLTYSHNVERLL